MTWPKALVWCVMIAGITVLGVIEPVTMLGLATIVALLIVWQLRDFDGSSP